MKKYVFAFLFFSFIITFRTIAQVTIGSGVPPLEGSLLDLKQNDSLNDNSDKGLGLPRVALVALDDLAPCVSSANATDNVQQRGLIVYNITENTTLNEGIYVWDGSVWLRLNVGNNQATGPWYQVNSPTEASQSVDTDSYLNAKVVVGGSTIIDNAALTVHGNSNVNGKTTAQSSLVTGNSVVAGTFDVAGNTTLTSTNIDVSASEKTFVINDGKSTKKGKFLQAMDDAGTAQWQNVGAMTVLGNFSSAGLTFNPSTNPSGLDTGATVTLPPGRWSVQCLFLFIITDPIMASSEKCWIQCRMYTDSGTEATYDGSTLVSGNITRSGAYSVLAGFFVVNNNTENDITYQLKLTVNALSNYGYGWTAGKSVSGFSSNHSENSIIAFALD